MASEPHDFDPRWIDWTSVGGADGQGFSERIKALEKWMRTHRGIDYNSAGPDYPHPSQRVRALYFFEGNGRLDPNGIQILTTTAGDTRGIYWLPDYTDTPSAATSGMGIIGGISGGATKSLTLSAFDPAGTLAIVSVNATTADAYVNITATGTEQAAILQWLPALTGTRNATLDLTSGSSSPEGVVVLLEPLVADPATTANGQFFWRSDTGRFRVRIGGTYYNLAFTTEIPTTMNKVPFAAKTTTYTTTNADGTITADATSGSFTITLVTAVGNSGLVHTFKKITAANVVTLDFNGSQTGDSLLSYALSAQWSWVQFTSDGANWLITGAG